MSRPTPSPAMVVACVALSFALAGSAVAGTDALNRAVTKSQVKQIAKKQAKKQLRKNVPNSHVNLADNATNAVNAQNATNAGAVNGLPANSLTRAAFASSEDPVGGNATLLTTTITAPVNGTLLINANSDTSNFNGVDTFVCFVELNDNYVAGSTGFLTDGDSSTPEDDCGSVAAANVSAGTYKVDFEFQSSFADATNFSRTLTAQFVAFNGAGARTSATTKLGGEPADRPHPEPQR